MMKAERLRAKVHQYLEIHKVSLRTLAKTAAINYSVLSRFLNGKRNLDPFAMRRLYRAIDHHRDDLSLQAIAIFRKYKRQSYNGAEIAIIGENLMKMGKVLASSSCNNLQQNATG